MIHLVLDTNILSGDPRRNSGPFRALVRLCKAGKAKLHVPFVVKNEFLTQQKQEARKLLKELRSAADKLSSFTLQDEIFGFSEATKTGATNLRKEAGDLVEQEWEEWLKEVCAVEYPVDPSHGERIIKDYFAGKPPFKAVKNRNDIPDSYVWQTILDLAKTYNALHVVSNDGAVYGAAAGVQGVVAYKRLSEFIDTQQCRAALEALADEAVADNVERAGKLLPTAKRQLEFALGNEIIDELDGKTVTDSRIPDDTNEGMIYMINEPSDVSFGFNKVEYYGDSEIGVPFEAITECTLNYAIFKADYYCLDERKTAQISIDERNEHYFDADEDYPIRATGTLQIKLDKEKLRNEKMTDQEICELFDDAEYDVEVDELEVVATL